MITSFPALHNVKTLAYQESFDLTTSVANDTNIQTLLETLGTLLCMKRTSYTLSATRQTPTTGHKRKA